MSPFVLVCVACGEQRELPSELFDPPSVWLHCGKPGCLSCKFGVRMRNPRVRNEPHP